MVLTAANQWQGHAKGTLTHVHASQEEKAGASMMTEEEQDEGQVSFRVYWAYFKSGSGLLSVLVLITLAAAEAMNQYQSVSAGLGEKNQVIARYGAHMHIMLRLTDDLCSGLHGT